MQHFGKQKGKCYPKCLWKTNTNISQWAGRDRITELLYEGKTRSEIARAIGRHKGTISRELKRNSSPEYKLYLSHRAQQRADQARTEASRRPVLKSDSIRKYVQEKLMIGWSPEIIAGRIKKDLPGLSVSHEPSTSIFIILRHQTVMN